MQPYDEIHPGEFQSSEKGRPAPTARVVARLGVLDELRKHERSTPQISSNRICDCAGHALLRRGGYFAVLNETRRENWTPHFLDLKHKSSAAKQDPLKRQRNET
jgi:hypothetical protein